ncbi:hypothetical protein GALMADRAFT_133711 [Galerina marginata CBS 339.88]|uniref:Uncharacterized protein n=1 Tax=Galerina marginata (strain CBS 339.88) TaxID=685588 RepID=A0A067TWR6_GALM3|nr:hypothetical protein GALMADRAFT_133711 [Galerina marginata CBS 339.88]
MEHDRKGFNILHYPPAPYLRSALQALLDNAEGEYFIDGNQYADIALYLMGGMSVGSPYAMFIPSQYLNANVASQIVSAEPKRSYHKETAQYFPRILSISSVRRDLTLYIQSTTFGQAYLEETPIIGALANYILRSEAPTKNTPFKFGHNRILAEHLRTVLNAPLLSEPVHNGATVASTSVTKKKGFLGRFVQRYKDRTA